jgi:hypothetical protein
MLNHALQEKLARTMLAREGIAGIWVLHLSAANAHRDGYRAGAASIIEIAGAAEREWLQGIVGLT